MTTSRQLRLPKYVQFSHGAYFYVRWNPTERKVIWKRLGDTYARMLIQLAELQQDGAVTMADLIERYRLHPDNLKKSPNTRRQRDWQLDKLKASFGKMLPDAVTTRHVYRFLDR